MKKPCHALFVILIVFISLQSCHYHLAGSFRNKLIDEDLRNEMSVLNQKLFKDIMSSNLKGVKQSMSDALVAQGGKTIDNIVNIFGPSFKAVNYKVLDEYYIKNLDEVVSEKVKSNHENNTDYGLEFTAINRETYVSLLVSTGLPVNCMVLAIYGKYDDGWKLNILQLGQYSVMDQTAPEYYGVAINHYTKGNYADATNMIVLSSQLIHPAGKYFTYLNEYEIKDTYAIIMKEVESRYHLPLTVQDITTHPQIFGISPQLIIKGQPQGILPLIKYVTKIPLTDTIALKVENDHLQKAIGDVFIGIDKNKPGILYAVFNKIPVDSTDMHYRTYLQTIKYSTRY